MLGLLKSALADMLKRRDDWIDELTASAVKMERGEEESVHGKPKECYTNSSQFYHGT